MAEAKQDPSKEKETALPKKFKFLDGTGARNTWSRAKLMQFMADQTKLIETEIADFVAEVNRRHELMIHDKNRIMKENTIFKKKM